MEQATNSLLGIPDYAEALAKERLQRQAAFLPVLESIGPFEARPLTLTHYTILAVAENPLLHKAPPSRAELAAFLWIVSPEFCAEARARDRFLKRCRVLNRPEVFSATLPEAVDYLADALAEKLPSRFEPGFQAELYSDVANICDRFACEYGWTQEYTMQLPLKCLLQYMKAQQRRANAGVPLTQRVPLGNPSDKIVFEHFAALNRN
jgi:hypothetical protein